MRFETTQPRPKTICLACGDALTPSLERSASLRCHDCRDTGAPIRADLLGHVTRKLRGRLRLRSAA